MAILPCFGRTGPQVRILPLRQHGERSSVGRTPDCGSGCRWFESSRSPKNIDDFIYIFKISMNLSIK